MTEHTTKTIHPRLRVVTVGERTLIVLGDVGVATFDVDPSEAVKLGLALMETGLSLGGSAR